MTDGQQKELEDNLKEQIEKATVRGMGIGSKAIFKVIYDKIKNIDRKYSKNDLLRVIKELKEFCEIGLDVDIENL